MKLSASLFVAALSAAVAVGSNAWAQTTTESETIMTTPLTPSVTTRTVTTRTLVNPPAAVIVNPPPAVIVNPPPPVVINRAPLLSTKTTTTTTESTATEDEDGAPVLGKAAVDGDTTIVFEAADTRDIHMNRLRTWDEFAQAHPGIANTLAYRAWLINDPDYLARHPALDAFFQAHPSIKIAMAENPGTFAAIPPRPGE